jgi:hypothetical protein
VALGKKMIGPLLLFDKSFVEMLNPEEVSELSMHFKFVGTPTLIAEIIADLKLEPSEKRVPKFTHTFSDDPEVVRVSIGQIELCLYLLLRFSKRIQ